MEHKVFTSKSIQQILFFRLNIFGIAQENSKFEKHMNCMAIFPLLNYFIQSPVLHMIHGFMLEKSLMLKSNNLNWEIWPFWNKIEVATMKSGTKLQAKA